MNAPSSRIAIALLFSITLVRSETASQIDAQLKRHLDGLRGVSVPEEKAKIDELNQRMDAAWTFIDKHPGSLTGVERALTTALQAQPADQFFLMDMSYLLIKHGHPAATKHALSALEMLDPQSAIIKANDAELFHLVMKLGANVEAEAERFCEQLDRLYLNSERGLKFFQAPHLVDFQAVDLNCMVYGVLGGPAARHLAALLKTARTPAERLSILDILPNVGSEDNVPELKTTIEAATDYETFARCVRCLMEIGGPSGRKAVLDLAPAKLDRKSKKVFGEDPPPGGEAGLQIHGWATGGIGRPAHER